MKTQVRFVPMERFPRAETPNSQKPRCRFEAGLQDTLDLLDRELQMIGAEDVLIQLKCDRSQIRQDGWPRSDCRAYAPVILTFRRPNGQSVSMPCDTYAHWNDNLRAVAKSLEALRAVDRYGVTANGEQYRGFAALTDNAYSMTHGQAIGWLAALYETTSAAVERDAERFVRTALKDCHPDSPRGNPEKFKRAMAARRALEAA